MQKRTIQTQKMWYWVTAQYGSCPICYKDRLERLERKPKIKKLSNPKGTMPKGYGQDTRYVFPDKPTMPKGRMPKK